MGNIKNHKPNEVVFTKEYNQKESRDILANFQSLHTEDWKHSYYNTYIFDGTQWDLILSYKKCIALDSKGGSNNYPHNWQAALEFFNVDFIDNNHHIQIDNKD